MSQMTSTGRVGARALNRPATTTPRLRVVTGAPLRGGSTGFGVICATLLATGLIGLLLLNTALAQGSFTLHDLRATSDQLTDTQDALDQSLAVSQSPAHLATRAAAMGLVPAQSSAFLQLPDGKVIGVAKPATREPGFTVVGTIAPPAVPAAAKPGKRAVRVGAQPAAKTAGAAPAAVRPAKPAKR